MSIIYLMLPFALLLGFGFLAGFLWVVSQGQLDELETPAHRMLLDDDSDFQPIQKPR
jgi:cbb3-type cytochrome oxidase maturation protein